MKTVKEHTIKGLVSVIIPVFNRELLVGKAVESVLAQTYTKVEIVLINDGSTDGTLPLLRSYAASHPGRITVIDQANAGQVRARNNGIGQARGEFIAFLDSDDTWEKEKLELQLPQFQGKVGLVYCAVREVAPDGAILKTVPCDTAMRGNIHHHLLVNNRMTGSSVVVTRQALQRVGIFDESFRAAENWDLWIRISREFGVDFVDKPLVNYLRHNKNISADYKRMAEATWKILQKHLPCPGAGKAARSTYDLAYANYHYSIAVMNFSRGEYRQARQSILRCWKHKLFYRDTVLRLVRTTAGRRVNLILSHVRQTLTERGAAAQARLQRRSLPGHETT